MASCAECCSGVRWVRPAYLGEVHYREFVAGEGLRHHSWKGLRDVDPKDVVMPEPAPQRSSTLRGRHGTDSAQHLLQWRNLPKPQGLWIGLGCRFGSSTSSPGADFNRFDASVIWKRLAARPELSRPLRDGRSIATGPHEHCRQPEQLHWRMQAM